MKKLSFLTTATVMVVPLVAFAQTDTDTPSDIAPTAETSAMAAAALRTGPVEAFGFVDSKGTKISGTPNWSSAYNAVDKRYEITIVNESYYYSSYSTVVTPAGSNLSSYPAIACKTDSVSGKLLISCYNKLGNLVSAPFSFIMRKY